MKLVGLISDTHIPSKAKAIPNEVFEVFNGVNLILHAGDLTQLSVVDELEQLAPVVAVSGNMDPDEVRKRLPKMNYVTVYNWKIGVIHDPGVFMGTRRMKTMAKQKNLDILVFGHTHRPSFKRAEEVLFINPGSPTNPLPPFITKPSVALLKITKENIEPEIIKI
ncbi:MAG: Phosphodiesterase [Candidatus Bathyarchaeota archaeon BA2]|nr:MAG: Phosphodiesterase [Candidatus Bathyarchaeota archaeon BA2]